MAQAKGEKWKVYRREWMRRKRATDRWYRQKERLQQRSYGYATRIKKKFKEVANVKRIECFGCHIRPKSVKGLLEIDRLAPTKDGFMAVKVLWCGKC